MKPSADEIAQVFKGLAIAAARARQLVTEFSKDELLGKLPRRQQDTVRQHLLEIQSDVERILRVMTGSHKP